LVENELLPTLGLTALGELRRPCIHFHYVLVECDLCDMLIRWRSGKCMNMGIRSWRERMNTLTNPPSRKEEEAAKEEAKYNTIMRRKRKRKKKEMVVVIKVNC